MVVQFVDSMMRQWSIWYEDDIPRDLDNITDSRNFFQYEEFKNVGWEETKLSGKIKEQRDRFQHKFQTKTHLKMIVVGLLYEMIEYECDVLLGKQS